MTKKTLVIPGARVGWFIEFRKKVGRPVEFLQSHEEHGALGGWQLAKNAYWNRKIVEQVNEHFRLDRCMGSAL